MHLKTDTYFLKLALKQAQINKGFCFPNPSVGSLIVDNQNVVLAEGYHHGPGLPHAEIEVLQSINFQISPGSTLYVTLEPCCHWGRTPPCVDAIIRSGIKRVVYGYQDPNVLVAGKGIQQLESAGIQCIKLNLESINDFYQSYSYWHLTKQPRVTAKIALSLNGAIAKQNGDPAQITGNELNELTHQLRKSFDAILTTVETIIHDDPQLNVRMGGNTIAKPIYILDSYLRLPLNAQILNTAKTITVFHTHPIEISKREQLINRGVRCIEVAHTGEGLSLEESISLVGKDGIQDLWVEAGGKCFASFVKNKILHRAYIYISLQWLNHGKIAFPMGISLNEMSQKITWRQYGNDVLCDIHF